MKPMAICLLVAGCGGGGTVDVGAKGSGLDSMGAVDTHGNPAGSTVRALQVTVKEVQIGVVAGGAVEVNDPQHGQGGTPAEGEAWTTVFTGSRVVDLTDAAAAEAFLGSVDVPAGRVTQVRLVLDGDPMLTVGGVPFPCVCPSCSESGIKIVPQGNLVVAAGDRLHLTLDFDAQASLRLDGTTWRMDPVIHLDVVVVRP
jgi:Domain of unknown function (DUF4382)